MNFLESGADLSTHKIIIDTSGEWSSAESFELSISDVGKVEIKVNLCGYVGLCAQIFSARVDKNFHPHGIMDGLQCAGTSPKISKFVIGIGRRKGAALIIL